MKVYQEIKLLESPEIPLHFLWEKVFQQIHLGLVEIQDDQGHVPIGLSFPEYISGEKVSLLGSKLRLLAKDEASLVQFNTAKWLSRLSDYVHCTSIRPVPEKITAYAIYQRQQPKANPERLARRYAKRLAKRENRVEDESDYENALTQCSKRNHLTLSSPFIRLKSLSSDNNFCLWIKKIPVDIQASTMHFSSYGLSSVSSVPEF